MKKTIIITKIIFLFLLTINIGCSKEDKLPLPIRGELLELTLNGSLSQPEVITCLTEFDGNAVAKYGVNLYSITYGTKYLGKNIQTKGLLIVPIDVDTVRLIMYCHGTEIPSELLDVKYATPSLYKGEDNTHREVRNMGLGWASAGYMVFIPDYVGYGLTLGKDHPYLYYPEMFISNFDGLIAVKSFISREKLIYDNRLFLTGWSQGAGAAISTHKYIQEGYSADFTVVASSGLAGPYNFERTAIESLKDKNKNVPILPLISWGIYSMNKFSAIKRPADQIYACPVFEQLSSVLLPSNKPSEVFNAVFLSKLLDGTDVVFRYELSKNSFHTGWVPKGKVFLHHGDADRVVPYYNSEDAYQGLTATGGNITFYTYPNGDHDTDLGNYILKTLNDFNAIK